MAAGDTNVCLGPTQQIFRSRRTLERKVLIHNHPSAPFLYPFAGWFLRRSFRKNGAANSLTNPHKNEVSSTILTATPIEG